MPEPKLGRGSLSQEPLVEIHTLGLAGENYYAREDGHNAPYDTRIPGSIKGLYLRKSDAVRLVHANQLLKPFGVELYVMDGLRPVETQRGIFHVMMRIYADAHPGSTTAEQRSYALQYASDPEGNVTDPNTVPLHATGGAVDVWLRDSHTGALLDLGTDFDDTTKRSETDALELDLQAGKIGPNDPALRNRRLLYWAMTQSGFENYPNEAWHYDYGDRMYMKDLIVQGRRPDPDTPQYGYIAPPSVSQTPSVTAVVA
jgi:D-alanyl-D-alanine dipeptidase